MYCALYPVYTIRQSSSKHRANVEQTSSKYKACIKHSLHEANITQTSSKHRANIKHLEHTSCTCILNVFANILNAFAGCLLDDCPMFAWSCKRGIKRQCDKQTRNAFHTSHLIEVRSWRTVKMMILRYLWWEIGERSRSRHAYLEFLAK